MAAAKGVVTWQTGAGARCTEAGPVAVLLRRYLFVNGLKRARLDECKVERQPDGAVLLFLRDGGQCSIAMQSAQEAESLAKQCCAVAKAGAAAAAPASPGQDLAPASTPPGCRSGRGPSLLGNPEPRELGRHWQAPVPDFGGRLAELLWASRGPALAPGLGGAKRRRMGRDQSFWRFLETSHSVFAATLVGVKERRAFVAQKVAFDAICQAVRERFPDAWGRLRPLQCCDTAEQDKQVALEVLARHVTADAARPVTADALIMAGA
mmetsp:Transcript_106221/g.342690  ORF Transcript_106221/g.342690 Transcript_106221/m.342690 type:complete len:265 (-) Transcript_106221:59-853(-)